MPSAPSRTTSEVSAPLGPRTPEENKKMSVHQALEAGQAAMTAKKSAKRNAEEITPDDSGIPEEDLEEPATTEDIKSETKKTTPVAKKTKVYLVQSHERKAWQVRVMHSSTERNKQFSYAGVSEKKALAAEKKAFAEAKAHCILICGRIGVALPANCK